MDIVNTYFRSREQSILLEEKGVRLVGSSISNTADLPALPAELYGLIDERFATVIFDVGGDANGARVLSRFSKQIGARDYDMYVVVNANRPFTQTAGQAMRYIDQIQEQSRLSVTGIVNNTHMLRETAVEDILKGEQVCLEIEKETGKPLVYNVCPSFLNLDGREDIISRIFSIKLYMRPEWL
ncbi:MAG: ATP-binding protein [Eubacteriaceae bacterium]|nr:ATP-binding protein [Eubacteriaceae bacterium]